MVLKWHKNSDFSRNFKLLGYRNTVLHGNLLWGKQFLQWPFDKLQSKQKWRKCIKFINSIGMKFLFRQKTDPGQNIHTTPFEWKFNFQGNSTLNICLILTLMHIGRISTIWNVDIGNIHLEWSKYHPERRSLERWYFTTRGEYFQYPHFKLWIFTLSIILCPHVVI